jgi:hypothetical protein
MVILIRMQCNCPCHATCKPCAFQLSSVTCFLLSSCLPACLQCNLDTRMFMVVAALYNGQDYSQAQVWGCFVSSQAVDGPAAMHALDGPAFCPLPVVAASQRSLMGLRRGQGQHSGMTPEAVGKDGLACGVLCIAASHDAHVSFAVSVLSLQRMRARAMSHFQRAFESCDVIMTPATPTIAPAVPPEATTTGVSLPYMSHRGRAEHTGLSCSISTCFSSVAVNLQQRCHLAATSCWVPAHGQTQKGSAKGATEQSAPEIYVCDWGGNARPRARFFLSCCC